MKATATEHLKAAAAYIAAAEGDKRAAYKRAADEIKAAQKDDPSLTLTEIGRRIGKSRDWVRTLLAWREACSRSDSVRRLRGRPSVSLR